MHGQLTSTGTTSILFDPYVLADLLFYLISFTLVLLCLVSPLSSLSSYQMVVDICCVVRTTSLRPFFILVIS